MFRYKQTVLTPPAGACIRSLFDSPGSRLVLPSFARFAGWLFNSPMIFQSKNAPLSPR
jgi:hypothetical protein